jgi:hypothetical protein
VQLLARDRNSIGRVLAVFGPDLAAFGPGADTVWIRAASVLELEGKMQLRSYEYLRLHDVCRDIALRSDSGDLPDRWVKMAQAFLHRAGNAEMIRHSRATETMIVER